MGRPFRVLAVAAAVSLLASGCAFQNTRYDYSGSYAGNGQFYESILDWNYPTSTNQGLLLPPERLQPFPAAVGVPWANGDPSSPGYSQLPMTAEAAPEPAAHEADHRCANDCDKPAPQVAVRDGADAGVREQLQSR